MRRVLVVQSLREGLLDARRDASSLLKPVVDARRDPSSLVASKGSDEARLARHDGCLCAAREVWVQQRRSR